MVGCIIMVKLTKEMILDGTKRTETIKLAAYNDAEIEIRPLSDREIQRILAFVEKQGYNSRAILEGSETGLTTSIAGAYELFFEIAKLGIVDKDIVSALDSLRGSVIFIGTEIMNLTNATESQVKSF
jgi:hypothetical protein